MAKLTYHGADGFADKLLALGEAGKQIARHALYDGAGVVANAVKAAAEGLDVGTPPGNSPTGHPYTGLTPGDKADIINAVGIAKFQDGSDEVNTAVSFNGYVSRTEKNFPHGVPVALLVRSIESGSSVRAKRPFVRHAVTAAKAQALAAMDKAATEEIQKIMG